MSRGLVLGKFLPYHAGHAHLIRVARSRVDELTVLVCSTEYDSIPGLLRYQWVRESHPDCRVVWCNEDVPQAPHESGKFWPVWTDLIARYVGGVDVVFTSELYGDDLARHIGATHQCVDLDRRVMPISGTAIRDDPMSTWEFIPDVVRPYFVRRVALVGSESTGKTTLAERIARELETTWVAEYGRAYCEAGRDALALTLPDFDAIGWGQAVWEDDAARCANRVLICDTDIMTTCTWSDLITGARPPLLESLARSRRYGLRILLEDDVPWIQDGLRVLDLRRAEHTRRLRTELERSGQPFAVVRGSWEARAQAVLRLIRERVLGTVAAPTHWRSRVVKTPVP